MSNYTLDTDVAEHFTFKIGENEYRCRFANTEETFEMADATDSESVRQLFRLVTPVSEGAPAFEDLMKSKNQVVLKRFGEMYAKAVKEAK